MNPTPTVPIPVRTVSMLGATLLLLLAFAPAAHAQSAEALMNRMLDAWNGPDYDAIDAMFATDVVAFNAGGTVIQGRENVAGVIQSDMRNAAEDGRQMQTERIRAGSGDNVAYHAGKWWHVYPDGERTRGGAYTFVFHRNDRGEWHLASIQIDRAGAAGASD